MGSGHSSGRKFGPHKHSLSLRDDGKLIKKEIKCKLCERRVAAPFYVCNLCKYYVHKSCGDLPLQINHSFHTPHPLHLFGGVSDMCCSCYREFKSTTFYKCEECDLKMDVECAMMPPSEEECRIQHSSHPHSLLPVQIHERDRKECFACKSGFSGNHCPAYGCTHCSYFLHKSCAEFPQEMSRHPLHPHHDRLSLVVHNKNSVTCSVCETKEEGRHNFNFKCGQCGFWLCWTCNMNIKRSIAFEDHEHALCFMGKMGKKSLDQCNGYDSYCRQPLISDNSEEFKRTKSDTFRCLDCDFRLHLLCGPLPSTIKHECHIHALTLLDSLVEDNSGEYYCDVCEMERDPRIRIYYCKECKYSAHVHCVISEVVNVLNGDLKGVKLKALGKDSWTRAEMDDLQGGHDDSTATTTLKDLIDQIVDEEEKKELKSYYKWDAKWSKDNKVEKPPIDRQRYLSDQEMTEILKLSSFTAGDFVKCSTELQNHYDGRRLELTGIDLGMKMVRFKGYTIPHLLAGVLETLLDEYGDDIVADIGHRSLSVEMKSFVLFILCRVVKRMSATLIRDITTYLLREWFFHLRFVRSQGFKIGFALAQAESLVDLFLARQSKRLEDEIPAELNKKMAKVTRKMDESRKERAGLQRDLEKCKQYRESSPSQKPEYMKYCLEKASEFRWRSAFDRRIGETSSSAPREQWKW